MNASLKDLIMSLYDLSPLEFDLLFALIARKKATPLDVLSKKVDRDKTTVFRCDCDGQKHKIGCCVLGKSSFQISENHDTAQMTFETKDSNTGDNLAAIAQDKGPVGGVNEQQLFL